MKLSAALIVKDEELTLARCLDSLRGAVDEIVVVDTGSTDATREIARRYTDRVFDFAWCDDFAAARQFAFDCATGDWVLWVDADDVVHGGAHLRALAAAALPTVGGYYLRYDCDRDSWGNTVCEFWRERLVRRDLFRWEGRVHEVLVSTQPCELARSSEVYIEHRRDERRAPQKLGRNLRILEREYAEATRDDKEAEPRLLFYLANEYVSAGCIEKALGLYQDYLQRGDWADERYNVQTRVADLFRRTGRYEQAISSDLAALKICPHWPDAYFGLAATYYHLGDWHKVIHWCEVGRAMPLPDTVMFVNPMAYRFDWIIYYTNALYHVGSIDDALAWTRHALEIKPDDEWHRQNFLTFTHERQAREQTRAGSSAALRITDATDTAATLVPTHADPTTHAPQPPVSASDDAPLRVVWEGPQFVRASFAFVNREMCSTLLNMRERARLAGQTAAAARLELSLQPLPPFEFGVEEDPARFGPVAAAFNAPLTGAADVFVQMSYHNRTEPPPAGRWVVFQPWDFTTISRRWQHLFETYVDEVWVPSRYVWRNFVGSGISPRKVHVMPHGVRREFFHPGVAPRTLPTTKTFKFLFVGGTLWRKGIDILLAAYGRAFSRSDDVCLVIKDVGAASYYRAHNAADQIRQMQRDPAAPEIVYLTDDVSDRDVAQIYAACDCLVHPFRGEGFALPVAEAMGTGLPVIVTQGGPCDDYATDATAYFIPSRHVPTQMWEEMVSPACVLEPDADALVELMRRVCRERDEARAMGARASRYIHERLTWEQAAQLALRRFEALSAGAPFAEARAAA